MTDRVGRPFLDLGGRLAGDCCKHLSGVVRAPAVDRDPRDRPDDLSDVRGVQGTTFAELSCEPDRFVPVPRPVVVADEMAEKQVLPAMVAALPRQLDSFVVDT